MDGGTAVTTAGVGDPARAEALDVDIDEALAEVLSEDGDGRGLPDRLGLSSRPDARWSDFVQLPPNRDLPSWASEGLELGAERVRAFDRAHHLAAAWGIVADRMDDGQVERTELFARVRAKLLDEWRVVLAEACIDRGVARASIDRALAAWHEGIEIETELFKHRGDVEAIGEYVRSIRLRLQWVSTSAVAMLTVARQAERAAQLHQAYGTLLCGLQCRDDAIDADDDRSVRGASVHEVLGLPRGGLVRAAPRALLTSAEEAERGGFTRLAAWVRDFAAKADVWWPDEDHLMQAFGGFVLSEGAGFDARAMG